MKTTKIILITALVTLGAVLFGQASQVEFITTSHSAKSSRFENLVHNFLSRTERTAMKEYHEPVVSLSYTVNQADVVYEEEYCTESWMLSPFESSVAEADLCLEPWMLSPFESSVAEADLCLEPWMSSPFESSVVEADLCLEPWMLSPFESSVVEADLYLEPWMLSPFEVA